MNEDLLLFAKAEEPKHMYNKLHQNLKPAIQHTTVIFGEKHHPNTPG
jgi:hypothetical protein